MTPEDPIENQPTLAQAIEEERRRARRLRTAVDLTAAVLMQGRLTRSEAERLVAGLRQQALALFPGQESTFDLILAPRFARLLAEFTLPGERARVLPFRRP